MLPELLIAYTTRAGSTAEVAEALGASVREAGPLVDVQPMSQLESLLGWKALIRGAPLYFGRFPGMSVAVCDCTRIGAETIVDLGLKC
jgi:menaquinone-dependent protoporphyrinogen oxidase